MTEPQAKIPDSSALEHEFFQREPGAPLPADYVDPELQRLPVARRGSQAWLLWVVAALGVFLGVQYLPELRYFLSPGEPLELGLLEELQHDERYVQNGQIALPSNRLVALEGIPERRSVADETIFYKLVGAHIYVEDIGGNAAPRLLRNLGGMPDPEAESYRATFARPGRLVAFEDLSRRYRSVVSYYSESYGIEFCGYEPSADVRAFRNNVISRIRLTLRDELGRDPTDEELNERLGPHGGCQRGYILMAGRLPSSYWWVPVAYVGLLLLVGFCLWQIVRSFTRDRSATRR